ncbi:tyrosine-type recombinase/integrase [Sulfurimonas autotrophica]|uniref:tyrosine-type recombinase/integrase n=1 Tax=Sulfurimonas autotrophica TaxID=202747 RepID=UPI00247A5B67|nr:site-specific integrase [Sulfurimonas autotrophica]
MEQNTEPGKVLTNEELELMFNTFKNGDYDLEIQPRPTLYLFSKILYFTGARPSGVIDIQVKHCNFDENKITIKAMKKGKSYQAQVRLELMELIKEWISEHSLGFNDYIFYPQQTFIRTGKGKDKATAYSGYRKQGQQVFNKIFNVGIPNTELMHRVSFYSLRRTAGTKVYKAKGIMHAMLFLNHTSVKTTQM